MRSVKMPIGHLSERVWMTAERIQVGVWRTVDGDARVKDASAVTMLDVLLMEAARTIVQMAVVPAATAVGPY